MEEQLSLALTEEKQLSVTPLERIKLAETEWVLVTAHLSTLLRADLNPTETALFHEFLKKREDDVKSFHKVVRERLEKVIVEKGSKVTDKGTLELDLGNGRVQRATVTKTAPDDKRTEAMLKRKGLSIDTHMDKDIKYKANEMKLRMLLEQQLITEADYKSTIPPVSYRIGKTSVSGEQDDE